jgi:hypothetical protein
MKLENFLRCLRAFNRRRPFQPYAVQLVTGDVPLIRHPEAVSMRGEVAMFTEPDARPHLFEATSVCQFLDLPTALPGPSGQATTAGGNGS